MPLTSLEFGWSKKEGLTVASTGLTQLSSKEYYAFLSEIREEIRIRISAEEENLS